MITRFKSLIYVQTWKSSSSNNTTRYINSNVRNVKIILYTIIFTCSDRHYRQQYLCVGF